MKNWYIHHNDHHLGPYSIDELKLVGIYNDDLVWKEGLEHWTKAETVAELKDMVVSLEHGWHSAPLFNEPEVTYTKQVTIPKYSVFYKWKQRLIKKIYSFYKKEGQHTPTIF